MKIKVYFENGYRLVLKYTWFHNNAIPIFNVFLHNT